MNLYLVPHGVPCFVPFLEHISLHITISHDKPLLTSKHTLLQDARLTLTLTLVHTHVTGHKSCITTYTIGCAITRCTTLPKTLSSSDQHNSRYCLKPSSKPQYVLTPTLPLGSESREWSDRTRSPVSISVNCYRQLLLRLCYRLIDCFLEYHQVLHMIQP